MKNTITILLATLLGFSMHSYSEEYEDVKVFFEFDSYAITAETQQTVNERKNDFVKENIVGFEIYGYADDLGTAQYNKYLSRKRAHAIKQLLIDLGISRKTIRRVKGKGEIKLVNTFPVDDQRQKNRRVEIKIIYGSEKYNTTTKEKVSIKTLPRNTKKSKQPDQTIMDDIRPSIINNILKPYSTPEKPSIEVQTNAVRKKIISTAPIENKENTNETTVKNNIAPKNEDDELDILTVMTKGERLTLEEILFVSGTAKLIKSSEVEIKKLAKTLKKNENIKIQILGHVCCAKFGMDGIDDATGERNLSVVRAKAVYDELKNLGVKPGQMIYEGRKSKEPLGGPVENDRRVEILILDL